MSGENYVNTASVATTAAPVGPADLTFTVAANTGFPAAPYWGMFEKATGSAELVRVTNVAGSTLTITRGQGGTSATSHGAGVTFEHVVPASLFNENETHNAATTAHGVTGVVVGTTGAQTVQDKNFRGAFRADYTDALPVGITASFESNANSAAARDGFVHKNTAGDAARSGFLLQQSGTDRFKVSNTGNVTITPASGTAVTANGPVTVTGTATLSGGVSTTTITASGAVNTGTVTSTGALNGLSASIVGTVHADGALDTDGTLTVDGASTLTGAVTAGSTIAATGAISAPSAAFTNQVTSYGGRVVPSVTSFPSSPVDGQVVYRADEVMFYRWSASGGAWGRFENFTPKCELRQTTLQTIGSGAWTALVFQTEDLDTHNGHAASSTEYIVPAGWTGYLKCNGGVGWAVDTGTSRGVRWVKNGTPVATGAKTVANSSTIELAFDAKFKKIPVVGGDVITLEAWQNKGSNVNTTVTSENQSYMSLEWVVQ